MKKKPKLDVQKILVRDDLRIVAVVDEDGYVVSACAFTDEDNGEAGASLVWTLMLRMGLTENPVPKKPPKMTVQEMIEFIAKSA